MLQFLIDQGADVTKLNDEGISLLLLLCTRMSKYYNLYEHAHVLIQASRNKIVQTQKGSVPLIDLQDEDGNTALMNLIRDILGECGGSGEEGDREELYKITQDFINAGANVNLVNKEGESVLDIAVDQEMTNVVRLLLKYGVKINIVRKVAERVKKSKYHSTETKQLLSSYLRKINTP